MALLSPLWSFTRWERNLCGKRRTYRRTGLAQNGSLQLSADGVDLRQLLIHRHKLVRLASDQGAWTSSGFDDCFDNAVEEFDLLRSSLGQQRIDPLSEVTRIFFALQEQQSAWRNVQSFRHRDNGV